MIVLERQPCRNFGSLRVRAGGRLNSCLEISFSQPFTRLQATSTYKFGIKQTDKVQISTFKMITKFFPDKGLVLEKVGI